jgi:hypothetical protein
MVKDLMGRNSVSAPNSTDILSSYFCSNNAVLLQVYGEPDAQAQTTTDADTAFDAFNSEFYAYNSGLPYYMDSGEESVSGKVPFWEAAELFELIIDNFDRTQSIASKHMIYDFYDGFVSAYGSDWTNNVIPTTTIFAGMCVACARAYEGHAGSGIRRRGKVPFRRRLRESAELGRGRTWWVTSDNTENRITRSPPA